VEDAVYVGLCQLIALTTHGNADRSVQPLELLSISRPLLIPSEN